VSYAALCDGRSTTQREGKKTARVTINRDYLLTIKSNGKSRYIPDEKLRGFCMAYIAFDGLRLADQ